MICAGAILATFLSSVAIISIGYALHVRSVEKQLRGQRDGLLRRGVWALPYSPVVKELIRREDEREWFFDNEILRANFSDYGIMPDGQVLKRSSSKYVHFDHYLTDEEQHMTQQLYKRIRERKNAVKNS